MASALAFESVSVTLNCAFRIAEVTSTHSQVAGRVNVKSPTLKVAGASARTLAAQTVETRAQSKYRVTLEVVFIMQRS